MSALAWLFGAPACFPLVMTLVNIITWKRGRAGDPFDGTVSVLIPARNEASNIALCVRAAAANAPHEIVIYDDQSTDETAAIVADLAREIPTVRVVRGHGVPEGWIGKPHACHQLARHASGDLLLFVDADTRLTPSAIERLGSLLTDDTSVVTATPHQQMVSFAERLLLPLLMLTYTSWFPLVLVARSRDARFVAANGQVMAVRRAAYDRLGGFAAVAHEIVDDVAFCRHAKRSGERVVFADGAHIASCRMYRSTTELWRGFSKNIYEGIGGTPWALVALIVVYGGVFVAPYVALALAVVSAPSLIAPAVCGVLANVATRALLILRHGHPVSGVVTHPVAVLGLLAIALSSWWWTVRGELLWAGRVYAPRHRRMGGSS